MELMFESSFVEYAILFSLTIDSSGNNFPREILNEVRNCLCILNL